MKEIITQGEIISHSEMCSIEGFSLQRGMNFRVRGKISIILMSLRKNAPYADRVEDNGNILIYEGHDLPRNLSNNPKEEDQPETNPNGTLTQNGKFHQAAKQFKDGKSEPELVKVYEKIKSGIWVYNGLFDLIDSWIEFSNDRNVFKFKLLITDTDQIVKESSDKMELDHNRMIPTSVKLEVWKRDKGKCKECGSTDNLHFDHILPFAKGGTSLVAENIQILCARHNLQKGDKML